MFHSHASTMALVPLSIANAGGRYIHVVSDTERLPKPEINPITRSLLNYLLLKHPTYAKQ